MLSIPEKIKSPVKSFCEEIKSCSEISFLALLILHMCVFYVTKINWSANEYVMKIFKVLLQMGTLLASASLLIYIIIRWKYPWKNKAFFLVPAVVLFALILIFNFRGDNTWYFAFADLFFCLMAYGKDYKKILRCYMLVTVFCLLVAVIGLPIGLTQERSKMDAAYNLSFGIVYPNTWGQIVFLAMIVFWYLFLQSKKWITFIVFWAMGIFMYLIPRCKTITLFAIAFPIIALFVKNGRAKENKLLRIILTVFPFICFAVTMVLCWQMDWVKKYTYDNALLSFGMRFVQGGIAFQYYGFPLIGYTLPYDPSIVTVVNGEAELLYVVDNAFVTFGLFRGAIWMLWALCWLGYANWRGMKNKDGALVMMSAFLMVFAIMERPGLEASYNFIFLYPLASVAYLKESAEKLSLHSLFALEENTAQNTKSISAKKKEQPAKKKQKR